MGVVSIVPQPAAQSAAARLKAFKGQVNTLRTESPDAPNKSMPETGMVDTIVQAAGTGRPQHGAT
jgi:hypothetical protein